MDVFDLAGKSIFESTPKKKKRYILFLYTMSPEREERINIIAKAIQRTLKGYVLVRFDDPDEGLKALIVKNVEIVIIDSSLFKNDVISVDYAIECKKRKKCPILFIASDPLKLIHEYREKLFIYEEFDNYFSEPLDMAEFSKKLYQLGASKGRVAKRFNINVPLKLFRLNNGKQYSVTLTDISLVGFGIYHANEDIFSQDEQVQIKIPLVPFKLFHPQYGEFLPISGRLRRVSINGDTMGFSIEHLTPLQIEALFEILSVINYRTRLSRLSEKPKEIVIAKKTPSSDMM